MFVMPARSFRAREFAAIRRSRYRVGGQGEFGRRRVPAAGSIVMPAELIDGETEELRRVARCRRGQTVHRDHVAGLRRGRHRHLPDVREEDGAVHGVEEPRGSFRSA